MLPTQAYRNDSHERNSPSACMVLASACVEGGDWEMLGCNNVACVSNAGPAHHSTLLCVPYDHNAINIIHTACRVGKKCIQQGTRSEDTQGKLNKCSVHVGT